IEFYLKDSSSRAAITLDQFYNKFEAIRPRVNLEFLIISSIKDELNIPLAIGYELTQGRKVKKLPKDADIIRYKDFMAKGKTFIGEYAVSRKGNDPAAILYSGGTTGTTKGILLSNLNFNALAMQTMTAGDCITEGHAMLSIMPVFHGFGLGVCIHTILCASCTCILVPRFNALSYAKLLKKKQPNYIAGVPTLFEALLRNPYMDKVKLNCLEGVFSGGDSLSIELKKKLDKFLIDHGAKVQVREGYGTTECVTASCLTPKDFYKEGSIGIPYPDTYYKIVKVGTTEEVPYNEDGEICLCGPSVMLCYCNNEKETADTLKKHDDGQVWLHTGDLGKMDEDGFIYFCQRIKRMIITSGYNVYPSQIENIIDSHEAVSMSCVIGVKDPYKVQKVKAFVVLKAGYEADEKTRQSILEYCKKNIAKYAMPYEIEFRNDFPKTLVGKVAYRELEKEELDKQGA
ncbi:MAG: AMP-binding protein, partial [Clostridia bacterium]